jgi:pyruvate formate lyase activating enzyme
MISGLVFNIQSYCVHDGPGIRTTVFLKGCPLRCWWCHNPESQSVEPEISLDPSRCIRCGACLAVCPGVAASVEESAAAVDRAACIHCGRCAEVCSAQARENVGQTMTVAQVMDRVLRDRLFYEDSGGGMTLSGGEPLMQPEFAHALLAACRVEEIPTAVDTCGYTARETLESIAQVTDLFLYDLKTLDDRLHRMYTGVSNGLILSNLERLGRIHSQIWVRIPVVPDHNDDPAAIVQTARFAASIPGVRQIHLLPYHPLASHKSARFGMQDRMNGTPSPSVRAMTELAEQLRCVEIPVLIGG